MRLPVRVLALILTVALALPLRAASAHPRLLKATPAAESRSAEAPRQIALTFNESLDLALTRVTVLRDGESLRPDSLHLANGDDKTVVASLGAALAPGRYTVRWQVTGDDSHPVRGEFTFVVLPAEAATAGRGTRRPTF